MKIYKIKVNGKTYKVELESIEEGKGSAPAIEKKEEVKAAPVSAPAPAATPSEGQSVLSPIQGSVVKILVKVGDHVKKGDVLLIIEAMKLENEVVSTYDGEVASILVSKGQNVQAKEALVSIK